MVKPKQKLRPASNAEIEKLKKKFGFTHKNETILHALLLLDLAADTMEEDGTIWIGKGDKAIGICFRK
jgi:hypothetical protein